MIQGKERGKESGSAAYMASKISSNPMWSRRDSVFVLAVVDISIWIKWIWLKHGIIADAERYHHVSTRLITRMQS